MWRWLSALVLFACSSPPPPEIPPTSEIGPPPAAALMCFPPYSMFAQKAFLLADLDQGTSCEVYIEQDECILGIYRDCTDPSPSSRQWVGIINSTGMRDALEFDIIEGVGGIVPRPPKCCDGELVDGEWAVLDCALSSCSNNSDTAHVGAYIESLDVAASPWGSVAGSGTVGGTGLIDFVFVSGRQEIWAITPVSLIVHEIGGASATLPINLTSASGIVLADHEGTAYVADGSQLLRIDTTTRAVDETVDLGAEVVVLTIGPAGVAVGVREGNGTRLSLRRAGDLSTEDATHMFETEIGDAVPVQDGNSVTAWVASVEGGNLLVLTSSLSVSRERSLTKPATKLFSPAPLVLGYFADCSNLSNMKHCYFELDLAREETRRIGIPDVGVLTDGAVSQDGTQMLFAGSDGGLGVLERATFRPRVRERVTLTTTGQVTRDTTSGDIIVVSTDGTFERIRQQ